VFSAEDVSTGISRTVDKNRSSFVVDQALHVIKINVPIVCRIQVVELYFDSRSTNPRSVGNKSIQSSI
jgi:hypothetical protein